MSSSEILEICDLLQQQASMIEQQNKVISKLLVLVGEKVNLEEFTKVI